MATKLTKAVQKNAGNDAIKKMTFSAWIKRSKLGEAEIFSAHQLSTYYTDFYFNSDNALILYSFINGSTAANVVTKRAFRDVNCWYHIMLVVDTTLATTNDRIKFYVNGVRETEMDGSQTHPAQDSTFGQFNDTGATLCLGDNPNRTAFEGAMSYVHYTPYTAYDASAFGSTDSNGVWKINTSPSVTYSTAGFFILKDANGITDQSGQSNNFTVASGTLTTLKDCPDNVFATMNPLDNQRQGSTFSNVNNTVVSGSSSTTFNSSTLMMASGKYYAEVKPTAGSATSQIGVTGKLAVNSTSSLAVTTSAVGYLDSGSVWGSNSNQGGTWATYANNDIIGIAVDCDNNKLYFSKNGVWQNSGVPTSGSTGTGAISLTAPSSTDNGAYAFAMNETWNDNTRTWQWNFGNGYFGTTAVATNSGNGYSGAEGKSKFNYQPPTGYSALSTKGLNQ